MKMVCVNLVYAAFTP
ncbi:hypothetical protein K6U70_02485 [Vibrio vulnificus]|nr:hypothetical protein [Vibrio vulnificus]